MSISTKYIKARPVGKVRFTLEAGDSGGAEQVFLVGSFNGWSETANPMKRNNNGDFTLDLEFARGEEVAFRYLTGGGRWLNEKDADEFRYCEFAGADNSILKLDA
jgi:1,4-alpha-glucan branching enzyme